MELKNTIVQNNYVFYRINHSLFGMGAKQRKGEWRAKIRHLIHGMLSRRLREAAMGIFFIVLR